MRTALLTTLMLAVPRLALACPMCFGQNDSPLAIAMNKGIIAMLVVVVGVLACFATFFIYLMRRARLAGDETGPAQAGHYLTGPATVPAQAGHYLEGQGGTAQC